MTHKTTNIILTRRGASSQIKSVLKTRDKKISEIKKKAVKIIKMAEIYNSLTPEQLKHMSDQTVIDIANSLSEGLNNLLEHLLVVNLTKEQK